MSLNRFPLELRSITRQLSMTMLSILNNISGVYEMAPKSSNIGRYITSISLGKKTRREFFTKSEKIRKVYSKRRYNFLTQNCNHFMNDYIKFVFGVEIPDKYQSFLKLG